MKYIKCNKCNNDGQTPEPCRCAERSDSDVERLVSVPYFEIWCAGNKTSSMYFESEDDAKSWQSSFGASVGISVWPIQVMRKAH